MNQDDNTPKEGWLRDLVKQHFRAMREDCNDPRPFRDYETVKLVNEILSKEKEELR